MESLPYIIAMQILCVKCVYIVKESCSEEKSHIHACISGTMPSDLEHKLVF